MTDTNKIDMTGIDSIMNKLNSTGVSSLTLDEVKKATALLTHMKKLGIKEPKKAKRADNENYKLVINNLKESEILEIVEPDLDSLFKDTITADKPQGNKWLIFTLEGKYSIAFLNNSVKTTATKKDKAVETEVEDEN